MDEDQARRERSTRQRRVILGILSPLDHHPSAEEVYREARKAIPRISLGTVYRNLGFLRDCGKVREIRPRAGGCARYEAMRPLHAHFHCSACHLVHDVPLPDGVASSARDDRVATVTSVEVNVVGLCTSCAAPAAPAAPQGA